MGGDEFLVVISGDNCAEILDRGIRRFNELQKEYNELHERLGYSRDDGTCRAINNRLGAILQEAMIRNFLFLFINILLQFDRRCGMIYSVLLCTAYREVPQ